MGFLAMKNKRTRKSSRHIRSHLAEIAHDEYRERNNSLPHVGEKVHDSRNRSERVLMHRGNVRN
jgi:hypothetical protein